ncbi:SAM-dependent methyltransferase [Shimia sp. CNT1-13L.2]|uniref:class I SAM-dependent methyltransferase n=1 Tax=Shimia sp. CNT1-13L.2 TaxID=2959663 RepID=UPI0020CEA4BB|nr:SAM-dependent methyltransferase [Shimia sp. CNT1-13L.2]MCP9483755.1 SAM-dependent methyltransferase [Shimia sp. CNT1-13L.2]
MADLKTILLGRIAQTGPMSLSDYMAECLLHPDHGYYATRDPLGAEGDFTTAPEISQMFGEMIGLCLAQSWLDQGRPAPFTLAEAGPGRGTLMADILRATRAVPGFTEAAEVHLIEASPTLRAKQRALLGDAPTWHDSITTLPEDQPLFFMANEFFDALPVRQFIRTGPAWSERMVGSENDSLAWGLGKPAPHPALVHRLEDTKDGDLIEFCPAAAPIIQAIGARIETHGGTALIIDYGDWRSLGDTLQALSAHEPVDPLDSPGMADLTTHVDFEALANATPSAHSRLTAQGVFLERLGITQRAQTLAARLSDAALESHIAAHRRLTHPHEMGNLFKVLALFPKGKPPPPGCET